MKFQPNSPQPAVVEVGHFCRVTHPDGTTEHVSVVAADIYAAKTAAAAQCGVTYDDVAVVQIEDPA